MRLVDHELSAKLESEIQLEAEATSGDGAVEGLPAHLKTFLDHTPWKLIDLPGSEEVVLTRKFGKEK